MSNYRVPVLEYFEWQQAVEDKDLVSAPGAPSKGDRYIVGSPVNSTDDWAGHENDITYYDGDVWQFDTVKEGMHVWVKDEDLVYVYDGSSWSSEGAGTGDMTKAVYDQDDDGIVDKAETIDDGEGNSALASDVKDAVDKKHTQGTDTALGDMASNVNMNTHKLTGLSIPADAGDSIRATAKITEANLEEVVDKKPTYVSEYEAIEFDNM